MADYSISNVPRRVVYAADGVGPYAFTFEILAQTDVAVYRDDTLLELTTDYTVSIDTDGTGTITLTATPTGATQIAIVGARAIQRLSDFTTGGDFFAVTVNDELDSLTIFAQQNAEAVDRALSAPQTDPLSIDMTLPRASVRAGKYLIFDNDGNPDAGDTVTDVSTVAGIAADVVVVSGISANVTSVAGNATNINTVAGINAAVSTVAGSNAAVVEVADNLGTGLPVTVVSANLLGADTIGTVAGSISNVNAVGTNIANVLAVDANETNINTVAADLAGTDTIGTVASDIANVNTVGTNIADVNEVADNLGTGLPVTVVAADLSGDDDIGTVAGSIANVNTTAGSIASVNTVAGELGVGGDVTIVATNLAGTDTIGTVATSIVNVNTVGTNIANVNTVAGISANVTTVAGISANVTTVAGISANVTTVAGISADVTAVAADATDIGTVAADLSGADTIGTVAASISNVNTVATNITNVNTVATNIADVGTVAGISTDVSTVADISTNVTTVAGVADDLNAVALTVAPVEAILPINFDIPTLWWDTGDRLLSGASERMIISNWQVTSLFDTEEGAWYDTYDASELGGATSPGDTVPSFGDKSGNSNDATGTNVLYATVPRPALYNNKVSSRMVVDLPYMGTNCTIGYCSDQGVTILTGRTVGGPTDILHDRYLFGYVVIDRALTAQETLRLTQYLESRKFGYVAPAEYDGAMLLEDGFSLLMENDDRVDLEGVITWPLSV